MQRFFYNVECSQEGGGALTLRGINWQRMGTDETDGKLVVAGVRILEEVKVVLNLSSVVVGVG
jgi:hypothetical protein